MSDNKVEFEQLLVDYPILTEQFVGSDPALAEKLLQEVDESSFTLRDWLESLVILYQWLDERGYTLSPMKGLGYVSCAAKSAGSSPGWNHLPSVVSGFLEDYGCELAVKKQSNES